MAEPTRSEKRQRRSDARNDRRSLTAKPFEALDEAAATDERGGPSRRTLKQAAGTAAAGAVAAGVAGAAKALRDRRDHQPAPESGAAENPSESERKPSDAGEPQAAVQDEQEQEDDAQPEAGAADDERKAESQPEQRAEEDAEAAQDESQAPDERGDRSERAPQGVSRDEAKEIVDQARRELQELLGAEPERVSGFERSQGRWTVSLEVVGVRRVPDTTDVLSTYEVAFDDDRNLVSVSETRRYRRSQVEEG